MLFVQRSWGAGDYCLANCRLAFQPSSISYLLHVFVPAHRWTIPVGELGFKGIQIISRPIGRRPERISIFCIARHLKSGDILSCFSVRGPT